MHISQRIHLDTFGYYQIVYGVLSIKTYTIRQYCLNIRLADPLTTDP